MKIYPFLRLSIDFIFKCDIIIITQNNKNIHIVTIFLFLLNGTVLQGR